MKNKTIREKILERFGTEGLDAWESVAVDPVEATLWEKLTVEEIAEEIRESSADQSEPEPSNGKP